MEILDRIRAVLKHESEAIRSIPVDESYVKAVEAILAIDGKVITKRPVKDKKGEVIGYEEVVPQTITVPVGPPVLVYARSTNSGNLIVHNCPLGATQPPSQ